MIRSSAAARLQSFLLASACALAFGACSGGGSGTHGASSGALPGASSSSSSADATLTVTIPAPASADASASRATAAANRRPQYVPASTGSLSFILTSDAVAGGPALPYTQTFNVAPSLSSSGVTCGTVAAGNYACTVVVPLPPGNDGITIEAFDAAAGGGNLLSQIKLTENVKVGQTNPLSATLAGIPSSVTVTPPSSGVNGSVATGFMETGSGPLTFAVDDVDGHGTAFGSQAGIPVIRAFSTVPAVATVSASTASVTVTPVSSGTSTIEVFAVAANGGVGTTALTIVSSNVAAAATTIPVQSGSAFTPGTYTIDAGTAAAEQITVASATATTLTLTGATAHAHAVGAAVANQPGIAYASITFALTTTPAITVALGGCVGSSAPCQIDEYSLSGTPANAFVEKAPILGASSFPNGELVQFLGFDLTNRLYNAEDNDYTIDEFAFNTGTNSSNTAAALTISGNGLNANTNSALGFTVAATGTTAAAVAASTSAGLNAPVGKQLAAFAPGGSTASVSHAFANASGSDWTAGNEGTQPDVAIMTDASGSVFGYALALVNLNYGSGSTANNKIGIFTTVESSVTNGIGGNFNDPGNPIVAWDQHDQALIYVDTTSGSYHVLEYPYSGGAFGAPTTIDTLTGGAVDLAVSNDGEIAVAYTPGNGANSAVRVYSKVSPHTAVDLSIALANQQVNAINFFADDSLLLVGGPNQNTMYDYPSSNGKPTATGMFSVTPSDTPAGFNAYDAAISK